MLLCSASPMPDRMNWARASPEFKPTPCVDQFGRLYHSRAHLFGLLYQLIRSSAPFTHHTAACLLRWTECAGFWRFTTLAPGGGEQCGTLRRHGDTWTTFSKVQRHVEARDWGRTFFFFFHVCNTTREDARATRTFEAAAAAFASLHFVLSHLSPPLARAKDSTLCAQRFYGAILRRCSE